VAKRSAVSATAELLLFSQLAYRRGTVIVDDKFKQLNLWHMTRYRYT